MLKNILSFFVVAQFCFISSAFAAGTETQVSNSSANKNSAGTLSSVISVRAKVKSAANSSQSRSIASALTGSFRVASTLNAVFNGKSTAAGASKQFVRWPVRIGSGDFADLKIAINAWYLTGAGAVNMPNGFTISKAALQNSDSTISTPILFAGQRSLVVPAGANDLQSDAILPTSFGIAQFSRGEVFWLKMELSVNADEFLPNSKMRNTNSVAGSSVWFVNPTMTTVSDVDALGAFTSSGTKPVSKPNGFCPIVLGHFVSGDAVTWFAAGDQIFAGSGDDVKSPEGFGIYQKTLLGDRSSGQVLAGLNFSANGAKMASWLKDSKTSYWIQYAKYFINQIGTNDFGAKPNTAIAKVQAGAQQMWTQAYNSGTYQVLQTKIGPRTTSTDQFATEVNQTPSGGAGSVWDTTGEVSQYNTWVTSQVGVRMDQAIELNSWRGVNPSRWVTDGNANYATVKGVLPSAAMHSLLAAELRGIFNIYP